ncbi:hypothetical protein [Amycolatopsis sp. NPDC051071]
MIIEAVGEIDLLTSTTLAAALDAEPAPGTNAVIVGLPKGHLLLQ